MDLKDFVSVAQFFAAFCAAGGLVLTALTVSRSRRTADLQALQKFSDDANEREAALHNAGDDASRHHAFNELMNFLELYACAYNDGLIVGRASTKMVRLKLIDSFIELDAAKLWHPHIGKAVDRTTTFIEFANFIASNRPEVERRKAEKMRALTSGVRDAEMAHGEA